MTSAPSKPFSEYLKDWSRWDTAGISFTLLLFCPPLAIVAFLCWGAVEFHKSTRWVYQGVAGQCRRDFTSLRWTIRNFIIDCRLWWRWLKDKAKRRKPSEPTVWDIHREIIRRYKENRRLINNSPMKPDARKYALEAEERLLEARIARLLEMR